MTAGTSPAESRDRSVGALVGAVVVVAAVLAFVFQNTASAEFRFLFFGFAAPLWLMMLLCTVAGFAVGVLVMWRRRRARRRRH